MVLVRISCSVGASPSSGWVGVAAASRRRGLFSWNDSASASRALRGHRLRCGTGDATGLQARVRRRCAGSSGQDTCEQRSPHLADICLGSEALARMDARMEASSIQYGTAWCIAVGERCR